MSRKFSNFSAILVIFIVYIIIVQLLNPAFITFRNLTNIFRASGFILIPAIGMTLVIIIGGIDLSIGATAAFGGIITALLIRSGVAIPVSILAGLFTGTLAGFLNGLLITRFDAPSLFVTIGMNYLVRGLVHIVSNSSIIYPLPEAFQRIEQQELLGVPSIVFLSLFLIFIFQFLLNKTTFGNQLFASGSDARAAHLVGIQIKNLKVICFSLSGLLSALSGIFIASRLGSAQTNAGSGLEFQVIAAVIIGGTSPSGGYGSIWGTILGVIFMSVVYNSMTLLKIPLYWQNFIFGVLIISMVIIDNWAVNKRRSMDIKTEKLQ